MHAIFLTTFWEVMIWLVMVMFWALFLCIFIGVLMDIFRRRDLSGIAKAAWLVGIIVLPLLGCLIYMIVRPPMATYEQDMETLQAQRRAMGYSPTEEIARAKQLLDNGTITQAEFDEVKSRALA
jgi:hypothetical protein